MLELAEENNRQVNEQLNNWTVIGVPNAGWAQQMFGEPDVERLWKLGRVLRPARRGRPGRRLAGPRRAHRPRARDCSTSMQLDAVRFTRPGHRPDGRAAARVALAGRASRSPPTASPTSRTCRPRRSSRRPTPRRTEGYVRSTRPLALYGRIVARARGALRGRPHRRGALRRGRRRDPRGSSRPTTRRLPRRGRARRRHLAHRRRRADVLRDALRREHDLPRRLRRRLRGGGRGRAGVEGVNVSTVHTDFMVGGPEVDVDAVLRDGTVVPLLRDDVWQLEELNHELVRPTLEIGFNPSRT